MKYHYTYRITNILTNKHYYGVRTSTIEPKHDLGVKYFSSSSNNEFIVDQRENKDSYRYKIVRVYNTRVEAIELEIKLHNKFNVGFNESFYNKVKQTSSGFDTTGISMRLFRDYIVSDETKLKLSIINMNKKHSNETRKKISESNMGKICSEDTRRKISKGNRGKVRTDVEKKHLSDINKGKILSDETKQKISSSLKGIKRSDEFCNNISLRRLGVSTPMPRLCCVICKRDIGKNNFSRHKCLDNI